MRTNKSTDDLEKEIQHLKEVIATLIMWIAGSAGSPLSVANAEQLINMLENGK